MARMNDTPSTPQNDKERSNKGQEGDSQTGGFSFSELVQQVAAWLVVASITAIFTLGAFVWNSIWTNIDRNSEALKELRDISTARKRDIEDIIDELKEVEAFHKWPRYTKEDAVRDHEPLIDDIEDLEMDVQRLFTQVDDCEERLVNFRTEFAKLPPLKWQERIVELEKIVAVSGCYGERGGRNRKMSFADGCSNFEHEVIWQHQNVM